MAMANDHLSLNVTKLRPASAPKPAEIKNIPKIILEERKGSSSSSSLPRSLAPGNVSSSPEMSMRSSTTKSGLKPSETSSSVTGGMMTSGMPCRSSSDIGLPASSMPNIALSMSSGADASGGENHLEVFCSPRTFRRSVDLELNSKEHTRSQIDWMESLDSSSNCLKVLNANSRMGSSISLNSECTARSIGLLSNDSDSDNDVSWSESEKEKPLIKSAQLRRFMSHPEEGESHEMCARASQSLSNLKTTDTTDISQTGISSDSTDALCSSETSAQVIKTPESVALRSTCSSEMGTGNAKDKSKQSESLGKVPGWKSGHPSHMLSYKCETHDTSRDGRIRQWLQDMDSHD